MLYQLIKRDPAWDYMLIVTPAAAAFLAFWHFLGPVDSDTVGFGGGLILHAVFSMLVVCAGLVAVAQQSNTSFQSALPVTVRQIFASRALSMLLLLWLPALVGVAILGGFADSARALTLVELASLSTLAMLALQSAGILGFTIPRPLIFAPPPILLGASAILDSADWPSNGTIAAAMGLCWLTSVAVFLGTWYKVPKSFQSAPREPKSAVAAGSADAGMSNAVTFPWKPLFQSVYPWGGLWVFHIFGLMIFGQMLFMCVFVGFMLIRPENRWLFALPIPPRALLSAILVPTLLAAAGGYAVGVHLSSFQHIYGDQIWLLASQEPLISRSDAESNASHCKTLNVRPSPGFWVPVKRGHAPVIQSPWGETFQPATFRVLGSDIFNPYAVGCENSERFLDWQLARATTAAYGHPVSRSAYKNGYGDAPILITRLRTQVVTLTLIVGAVLLSLVVALLDNWYRLRRLTRAVSGIPQVIFFIGILGGAILFVREVDLVQWVSWILPGNLSLVIALAAASLIALYWCVDILFRQLEFADKAKSLAP